MMTLVTRGIIAAGFSAGIFLGMSYLIAPGEMPPEPINNERQISITRKERDETSLKQEIDMPTPPKSETTPPPLMARAPAAALNRSGFAALTPNQKFGNNIDLNPNGNRRAIPTIKFPPEYPPRPLQNGIEGWVMLEFTIAPDGSVTDIEVVDGEPERTFDRAAIRAIQRWSYQPKMVDGRPVAQYNMREVFRFEIKD